MTDHTPLLLTLIWEQLYCIESISRSQTIFLVILQNILAGVYKVEHSPPAGRGIESKGLEMGKKSKAKKEKKRNFLKI